MAREEKQQTCRRVFAIQITFLQLQKGRRREISALGLLHACRCWKFPNRVDFLENGKYIAPGSMHLGGGRTALYIYAFLPTSGNFFFRIRASENKTCLAGCKRKVVVWAAAATASEGALDKWMRAAEIKTLPSSSSDQKCI